jgi:hypothetical protein
MRKRSSSTCEIMRPLSRSNIAFHARQSWTRALRRRPIRHPRRGSIKACYDWLRQMRVETTAYRGFTTERMIAERMRLSWPERDLTESASRTLEPRQSEHFHRPA